MDRLARNVAFISNLMEANVEFEAVDFPQANRLTIHILSAVAEPSGATSLRAIARELNARGITAPRGGNWLAPQVAAVLARASI